MLTSWCYRKVSVQTVHRGPLAHSLDVEADLLQVVVIQDASTVEGKRWFQHTLVDRLVVQGL